MKRSTARRAAALALAAGLSLQPLAYVTAAHAEENPVLMEAIAKEQADAAASRTVIMYRLYNRWSGEHLYTSSADEIRDCMGRGWAYEAHAWVAPATSSTPVYRLYNKYSGDHHYTTSKTEYDTCAKAGWTKEGVAWYSADSKSTPLYRGYNPYEEVGTHHYTASSDEMSKMAKNGWRAEGVAWYGLKWVEDKAAYDAEEWVVDHEAYDEQVRTGSCYEFTDGHRCYSDEEAGEYQRKTMLSYSVVDVYETVHHDEVGHWETIHHDAEGHWE